MIYQTNFKSATIYKILLWVCAYFVVNLNKTTWSGWFLISHWMDSNFSGFSGKNTFSFCSTALTCSHAPEESLNLSSSVKHLLEVLVPANWDQVLLNQGGGIFLCCMFVIGGDDLDSPKFPSSITCCASSPAATESVTSSMLVPANTPGTTRLSKPMETLRPLYLCCIMEVWMELNSFRISLYFERDILWLFSIFFSTWD